MLYRIAWKALATGATGFGTALFEKAQAQQIADELNDYDKDYDILHWIEAVPDDKDPIDTP